MPLFVDPDVLTYESLIGVAENRNATFLRILKDSMQKHAAASAAEGVLAAEDAE